MKQEEWYSLKASVADAFSVVNGPKAVGLSEGDIDNLNLCLSTLNNYLDNDFPQTSGNQLNNK